MAAQAISEQPTERTTVDGASIRVASVVAQHVAQIAFELTGPMLHV